MFVTSFDMFLLYMHTYNVTMVTSVASLNSYTETDESSHNVPSARQEVAQQVYASLVEGSTLCTDLLGKVKWSCDLSGGSQNSERLRDKLSGTIRGFLAEIVSDQINLGSAETVFSAGNVDIDSLRIVTPQEFVGSESGKKGSVLKAALDKSFEDSPLQLVSNALFSRNDPLYQRFIADRKALKAPRVTYEELQRLFQWYVSNMRTTLPEELTQGYVYGPSRDARGNSVPAGEFFASTVLPDGIVTDTSGNVAGIVEVKAYTADELAKFLQLTAHPTDIKVAYRGTAADFGKTYPGAESDTYVLGADLLHETAFVNIVRDLEGHQRINDEDNLIVLRFPNDVPDNLLYQYGERVVNYGYPNVLIQKLPLSGNELDIIGKEVIKSQWSRLMSPQRSDRSFSKKALEVLAAYAGIDTA